MNLEMGKYDIVIFLSGVTMIGLMVLIGPNISVNFYPHHQW